MDSEEAAAALVAVVLQEPVVRAPGAQAPLLVVADLLPGPEVQLLAPVPPEPVLLRLLPLLLPQVVAESEVPLHLQGRQSFSAAMARSSPPTGQRTYERAPSTRSPRNGRLCPSASRNWMPVRG